MGIQNPMIDIYNGMKQQILDNSLQEIKNELKAIRNEKGDTKLIELEMYQANAENTQKKMVSINTRYIVFVEDSDPCTIIHMSNGALLKVVESCDAVMKLVDTDRQKSYIG